jgi:hypothetical protein
MKNALALLLAAVLAVGVGYSQFPITIATNTLYRNTNTSALQIYSITHSASLSGYLGAAPANMMQVIGETGGSVTISSVVYSIAGYNMSATMTVEPDEYYKFNFTDATFYGQWLPLGNTTAPANTTTSAPLGVWTTGFFVGFLLVWVFMFAFAVVMVLPRVVRIVSDRVRK